MGRVIADRLGQVMRSSAALAVGVSLAVMPPAQTAAMPNHSEIRPKQGPVETRSGR